MSAVPLPQRSAEEDSQLGTWRRIRLYIRNPRDAFSIISRREQRIDAVWIFFLYFLVKLPVLLQKYAAQGRLGQFSVGEWVALISLAVAVGVAATLLGIWLGGLVLHLIVNRLLGAGRTSADTMRFLVLCLAPYLLLAWEYPTLILGYSEQSTFLLFLVLRMIAGLLVLRTFYWGLRKLFGLSGRSAVAVTSIPVGLVALLVLAALGVSTGRP